MSFKSSILFLGEENLLRVEDTSEFLSGNVSLSESVMINKELLETNTVLFNNILNLGHELLVSILSAEVSESSHIGGLGTSGWSVDHILEAVGVPEEVSILNLIGLVSIYKGDILSVLM